MASESKLPCLKCGNPSALQCPKCVELKLPQDGAAFCSQECFKALWNAHKIVHLNSEVHTSSGKSPQEQLSAALSKGWLYCLKKGQGRTSQVPHFDWTGTLMPYPISGRRFVPDRIDKPDWAIDGIPKIEPNHDFQRVVEIKSPKQIERMRKTCRIAREVLDVAARAVKPGVTTDEIDELVHNATIAAGRHIKDSAGGKLCEVRERNHIYRLHLNEVSKQYLHVRLQYR